MAQKEYTKIGARGRRSREFFTWKTLWLSADHLLQIEHTGYSEEYKRFYYRDIQSISVRRNNRALVWSIFFCVMMALGLALLIYTDSVALRWFWGCFSALFFLSLLIHVIKGASCISHIRTAVQQEELPSLRRVRKTEKALAQLRARVAVAQGSLPPEEVRNLVASGQHLQFPAGTPAASASPVTSIPPEPPLPPTPPPVA
jgi:hypothetical protein